MKHQSNQLKLMIAVAILYFALSGCQISMGLTGGSTATTNQDIQITISDTFQGVKDGNVESVPLPVGNAYITVEVCVENLSAVEQSIHWGEVFITTEDNIQTFPIALGYDQADAFSWLLPIAEPIGAKSIDHTFYFFRIQNDELMRIPAFQSVGCDTSLHYKSLSFLFIVPNHMAGDVYTLHVLDGAIPFAAKRIPSVAGSVFWGTAIGFGLILIVAVAVVVRKKRAMAQGSPVDTPGESSPGES